MDPAAKLKLRDFLQQSLNEAGDRGDFDDHSSLFISGRLNSLAMTRLVVLLEELFHVDFGAVNFEVELIDSVDAIEAFVESEAASRA